VARVTESGELGDDEQRRHRGSGIDHSADALVNGKPELLPFPGLANVGPNIRRCIWSCQAEHLRFVEVRCD
jgi:hypothetical protein